MDLEKKEKKLKKIAKEVERCRRCSLWKTPRSVPGIGKADSEVVFLGEAPGFHEARLGLPFVGASGKLLDKLLIEIGLDRKDVFICNMLRHRPPDNREPLPEEIEVCRSFLDEQIEVIDPKIIVTLGRFSMNKFLPGEMISRNHGRARYANFAGKKRIIIPMYHPAAALRNGKIMKDIREDFQKILDFLKPEPDEEVNDESEEKEKQLSLV